jgi:hypothetical protein
MGTATLPIHSRKEKRSIFSSSPKKVLSVFIFLLFLLYTLTTSNTFIDNSSSSPSASKEIDYNINPLFWAPSLSDRVGKSAYPKDYFTAQALQENELNPVSAVLLRVTDDDESIVYTVKHLLKYHFITEIYIHNLVKTRPLTVEVISP